jgi:hypothetical protein
MAIVRCEKCGPTKGDSSGAYSAIPRKPIGYPIGALLCGRESCEEVGKVWLTESEAVEYDELGRRFFGVTGLRGAAKFHVE